MQELKSTHLDVLRGVTSLSAVSPTIEFASISFIARAAVRRSASRRFEEKSALHLRLRGGRPVDTPTRTPPYRDPGHTTTQDTGLPTPDNRHPDPKPYYFLSRSPSSTTPCRATLSLAARVGHPHAPASQCSAGGWAKWPHELDSSPTIHTILAHRCLSWSGPLGRGFLMARGIALCVCRKRQPKSTVQ